MPAATPDRPAIEVWITAGAATDAAHHRARVALLSQEERARLASIDHAGRRDEFLLGRALIRTALSRRHGRIAPHAWPLRVDARGRPELIPSDAAPDLRFNLTHTDGLVACSVTHGRAVGIDAERHRPIASCLEMARRFLARSEAEALALLPEPRRGGQYLRHWTLREAYTKAHGRGLAMPTDEVAFAWADDGTPRCLVGTAAPERWRFWQWNPTPDHTLAVCGEFGVDESATLGVEHVIL